MRTALLLLGIGLASPAWADCEDTGRDTGTNDTGVRFEDCDGDSYRKMDGDCDDYNAAVNPGRQEDCDDSSDNNCDGFFNEGCESGLSRGTLIGGSACGSTGTTTFALLMPLLLLLGRRR